MVLAVEDLCPALQTALELIWGWAGTLKWEKCTQYHVKQISRYEPALQNVFFETYDHDTILDNNFQWEGNRSRHDKNSDSQVTLRKDKAKLICFHFPRLSYEQLH